MAEGAKRAILDWSRRVTSHVPRVKIDNMLSSWQDGLAFCAILHHYLPEDKKVEIPIADLKTDTPEDKESNIKLAFDMAEKHFGLRTLIDPEDVGLELLSMITALNEWHLKVTSFFFPLARTDFSNNTKELKY